MKVYKLERDGNDLMYKGIKIKIEKEHKNGPERYENVYIIDGIFPGIRSKSIFELCRLIEKGEINGRKSETCAG